MSHSYDRLNKLLTGVLRAGVTMHRLAAEGDPDKGVLLDYQKTKLEGLIERAYLEVTMLEKIAEGYVLTQWIDTPKGFRAVTEKKVKISFPSRYTANRVCPEHGNYTKLRRETGDDSSGVRILDVLPCTKCAKNPAEWIQQSPVNN